jgi:hypothetical protein
MKSHTDVEVELYASVIFCFGIGYDYQPSGKISWISQLIRRLLNIGMWAGHIENTVYIAVAQFSLSKQNVVVLNVISAKLLKLRQILNKSIVSNSCR